MCICIHICSSCRFDCLEAPYRTSSGILTTIEVQSTKILVPLNIMGAQLGNPLKTPYASQQSGIV